MKLGIVADELDRDFEKSVRIGKSIGLRRFEVRFLTSGRAPMCDPKEMFNAERTANHEDVQITALSPGLFKHTHDAAGFAREMSEIYPKAAEWAHRWKLPGLIVFGFQKPGATEDRPSPSSESPPNHVTDWLAEAGEQAVTDGLLLMIEPEPICWVDTGVAAAALIQRASVASLRINYDPGNVAWLQNRDPLDEFAAIAPWIANVHVKDLRPVMQDPHRPEFVPPGEGMIDYRAHCSALRRIGYEGPISLEPHMDGSASSARRCKEAFERAWHDSLAEGAR